MTALPNGNRNRTGHIVRHEQNYKGPIPPPSLFRQYGEVVPDAPERILKVFEEDSKHVREIRAAALEAQRRDNRRVHWMAYSLIAGGLLLSFVFAYGNKDGLAGTILGTTLLGSIGGLLSSLHKKGEAKSDEDDANPKRKK